MPEEKQVLQLQEKLSNMFKRKYVFLVGRATTGIYLALKAMKIKDGNVVMPDILCPSPADAVLYNNLKPKFCDVNLFDFNMNIASLNEVIDKSTKAIIPVHLFGQPSEMDKIEQIAEEKNLFVIEDVAQAFGGSYKGKKLGRFGDVAVLSFGGKTIKASDGGALITDDENIAKRIEELIKKLPNRPKNLENIFKIYRRYFYTSRDVSKKIDKLHSLFLPLPRIFKKMYLYKFNTKISNTVLSEISKIEKSKKKREENALKYIEKLQNSNIIHPKYKFFNEGIFYRYSILVKDSQEKVSEDIRRNGFDASNLYYPLHKMYRTQQKPELFKNSEVIGNQIINLWVEPRINSKYVEGVCKVIINSLNK